MNLTRAQQLFVGLAIVAILSAVAIGVRGRYVKAKALSSEEVYTPPGRPPIPATITVQVAGAVRSPGLKALPRGARVNDAVQAAGGPAPDADMAQVNLAAPLDDGQRIDVPFLSAPAAQPSPPPKTTEPPHSDQPTRVLDLNTATAEELQSLPGVGPALAQAIVEYRRQVGGFRRVEDLEAVPGIGPKRLADIRPYATVQ